MEKIRSVIDSVIEKFLIVLMSVLVFDVLWQVTSRYLLSSPSSFTDELAGFLLIWVGLLGAAYVAGKNEHLAIDLMMQKMKSAKKRKKLAIIIHLVVMVFSFMVLLLGGSRLVYSRFAFEVKSAALELPLGYVYLVVPLSGLLIIYYTIDNIVKLTKEQ